MTQEEEDRIRKDECNKWIESIRRHQKKCPGFGGECVKEIADERLQMRLDADPNLPVDQWWP